MPLSSKQALELARSLELPISTCHKSDGTAELFVHTDPKSLDESLPPIERSLNQALEMAKHMRRGDDGEGGCERPKSPILMD